MNDILFPSETTNEVFNTRDKNLFSSGHVDMFFERGFDKKKNFVLFDG